MAAPVSNWEKFRLLLWKNWILQKSSKWSLIVELFLPVIFATLLILVRGLVKTDISPITRYNEVEITNLNLLKNLVNEDSKPTYELYYSPRNQFLDEIIKGAVSSLSLDGYKAFDNASALEYALSNSKTLGGIQFDDSWSTITDYPEKLSYAIRFPSELRTQNNVFIFTWLTMRLFPQAEIPGPRNSPAEDGGIPVGYLREGFLPVQNAVTMSYLKLASKAQTLPEIVMQRYPYPEFINDPLVQGLPSIMSLIILLSFIYPAGTLIKTITTEKEKQLKEVMKIMGLQNWIHWTAWFVRAFISWTISAIIICGFLKIPTGNDASVLSYSDWSAVFLFFLVYVIVSICFCFMFAVFFSKASTAAAVSGLIWFLFYVPFSFSVNTYDEMGLGAKLLYCLFSNSAMGFGIKIILDFEASGEGIRWSNLFSTSSVDEDFTLGACMGMMLLSCIIYLMICLYIEQIFPGEYGVSKKWYFPFTKDYWCSQQAFGENSVNCVNDVAIRNSAAFEREPIGKHAGLRVKNLRKTFGDKTAVKNLSVNMYEDEITVLLGHNGAGKTTTISMLTGMFPPTSGTATVNGYDIRTNTDAARSSMGICPQHNVLFEEMSVANHIIFFSRLKGVRGAAIQAEVDKYLKIIDLERKANEPAKNLSGGMKRKLSVCCALCGDTKVVLCDEPSSGMDPAARRQLWDLLQAEKIGRTVLLTTHFMDEADVLGDRIAIMCGGDLKCCGSSFFLKKKYGSGYRLICVKREDCKVEDVTHLLNRFIPEMVPESDIGAELIYLLPDNYSSIFEDMFATLEVKSDELNLSGYGIGITSMEEVFMKVGAEGSGDNISEDTVDIVNGKLNNFNDVESMHSNDIFTDNSHLLHGSGLCRNQWHALFLKKMLYTWRNKIAFLIQILMPIFFVVLTILISINQGTYVPLKSITFSLKQYPTATTVLETKSNVASGSLQENISKYYTSIANSYGKDYTLETTGALDFESYILKLGETFQVRINAKYMAAATIAQNKITAWLNNQPYHTAPLTVNLVHNALAKALIGPDTEIKVTNAPLPYSKATLLNNLNQGNNLGTQLATNICFVMCFVSSFYVLFAIKERVSRAKLLQFVSGVEVWSFWLTQLIWDMATYIFTALITIATIACFQEDGFATFSELGRNFLLLLIFGISVIPFTYLISFTVDEPASGFSRSSIINIFAGMALFITYTVMSFEFFDTKATADILVWIFRLFPHFSLATGINKLYTNYATRSACVNPGMPETDFCNLFPKCCNFESYFARAEPGILPEILYLCITAVIFFFIIIISEYQVISELMRKGKKLIMKAPDPLPPTNLDDDVERERKRVMSMSSNELIMHNLVLDRVTKFYGPFLAVDQVSLGVKGSECFGLLGVNGAGKTTTFKMMTGDESITYGQAYVKGMSLKTQMNSVYKEIGYCPQFDALLDDLTGRETLRIFSLLRGVPTERIDELSQKLAEAFGFKKHLDKPTVAYSGGNKRKLSTALAVLGSPSVIYLDEPTTGMDPAARRQLWNMLCRIRDSGKSIILTSHSMEECEALCTRLAIMVNGTFKCIGSTQHLKNKFSKGLILKIKVEAKRESMHIIIGNNERNSTAGNRSSIAIERHNDIERVKQFVTHEFPQSELHEEYQGILTYYIPLSEVKWSHIFGLMERNRNELNIEDYSINQTTLEQIFLDFAKLQREDKRILK